LTIGAAAELLSARSALRRIPPAAGQTIPNARLDADHGNRAAVRSHMRCAA
jgi:hypothetical protein